MSVSFTDEEKDVMQGRGYDVDESELGYVYYPKEGIAVPDTIVIKYMEYPWLSCFEVDGVEILKDQT